MEKGNHQPMEQRILRRWPRFLDASESHFAKFWSSVEIFQRVVSENQFQCYNFPFPANLPPLLIPSSQSSLCFSSFFLSAFRSSSSCHVLAICTPFGLQIRLSCMPLPCPLLDVHASWIHHSSSPSPRNNSSSLSTWKTTECDKLPIVPTWSPKPRAFDIMKSEFLSLA